MWPEFALALAAAGALLYVPGYLLLRAFRLTKTTAFVCAPMASLAAYAALPIAYYELSIPCSVATVALPTLLVGALAFVVSRRTGAGQNDALSPNPQAPVRLNGRTLSFDVAALAAYALVGTAVCAMMFVANLPNAAAFYARFDNQTHLNLVQAFLDSGKWSTLHANVYLASAPNAAPVASTTSGFYPAAFHGLLALVCSIAHVSVPVATNAVVSLVCALTFPTCMFLLIRVLAKQNRAAVWAGSLCVCGSAVLPWAFALHGPTWPDMVANALVCAFAAVIVLAIEQRGTTHPARTTCALACLLVGLALMHPNAIFTLYIFLGAYGGHVLWNSTSGRRRAVTMAGYALALAALWALLHLVPLFRSTLGYQHTDGSGLAYGLRTVVTLSFGSSRTQPVLIAGLVAGIVWCVRNKRLWLLFAPAFFAVCYLGARANNTFITYWIGGFWYTNAYRFGTRFLTFALPVIAFGSAWATGALHAWLGRKTARASLVTGVAVALVCAINYWPVSANEAQDRSFETAFGRVGAAMHENYDPTNAVYDADEAAFVARARDVVPAGDVVLNFPHDGSVWAYGASGLNTYYRYVSPYKLTDDATLIASSLGRIASDPAVRDAVRHAGARWLLLLDVGATHEQGTWLPQYHDDHVPRWAGVASINDQTPGFSVVLTEGDMRLYRIDVAGEH